MTSENSEGNSDRVDPLADDIAEEEAADEFLKDAMRARSDKSPYPGHPNFDAGIATERGNHIDKFGDDPEDQPE